MALIIIAALAVAAVFAAGILRRGPVLIAARMTAQAAFLLSFLLLLTQAAAPIEGYLALKGIIPVDLFLRLSPLLAVSAMLAGQVFIASMLLAGVTLASAALAGRFFCGWVCPLGTTFDIFDRAMFVKLDRPRARAARWRGAKYLLLAAVLAAAIFGAGVAGWFDPISIATRSYGTVLMPTADAAAKATVEAPLGSEALRTTFPRAARTLYRAESAAKTANILSDYDRSYLQMWTFLALLAALIGVQAYQKRLWCGKICPLGAMLGAVSGRRPLGVHLDAQKCVDCGKCRRTCPLGAIEGKNLLPRECTFCGMCVPVCPTKALQVRFAVVDKPLAGQDRPGHTDMGGAKAQAGQDRPGHTDMGGAKAQAGQDRPGHTDMGGAKAQAGQDRPGHTDMGGQGGGAMPGRRSFIAATVAGIAAVPMLAIDRRVRGLASGSAERSGGGGLIRPPGAQDEERFLDKCARCGECMKACPNNALHPSGPEAGLWGLWAPKIAPGMGYCAYDCLGPDEKVGNFCATVCPTGAIARLTPEEKHATRLGTAYFRTDKCIPYAERKACSVCVEHCPVPTKALKNEIVEVQDPKTRSILKLQRPYVDRDLCIGCGQCQYVCPLRGEKGIRIEPAGA